MTEKVFSEHGVDADIPNAGVPAAAGPVCPQLVSQPRAGLPGAGGRGPEGGQHGGVGGHGAAGRGRAGGQGRGHHRGQHRPRLPGPVLGRHVPQVGMVTATN